MFRYSLLNLVFLTISVGLLCLIRPWKLHWRIVAYSGLTMWLCMLLFNTYLTALPIVRYNTSYTLGIRIGTIPLEDFSYLIVAVILAPALYTHFSTDRNDQ